MRASIPQGFKDSSTAGGGVWTEREPMLKNKPILALADNRIMVELRTFQHTLLYKQPHLHLLKKHPRPLCHFHPN